MIIERPALYRNLTAAGVLLLFPAAISAADERLTVSENAPQAWQPYDGATISFDVFRKGDKAFGTHTVSFDVDEDGSFTASTDVSLKAGFGPITVFRYTLQSQEYWQNDILTGLEAETNDDGEKERVSAEIQDDTLSVNGTAYSGAAPAGIIPSSHWNIQQVFSNRILSTENGELLETDVSKIGRETISVDGESIEATRYRLKSDLSVDLWYDDKGRWIQLSFEARGQQIDYRLTEMY